MVDSRHFQNKNFQKDIKLTKATKAVTVAVLIVDVQSSPVQPLTVLTKI